MKKISPSLNFAEAIYQVNCSESTLRRKLQANQIAGADRNDDGSWQIPIHSLAQAGLLLAPGEINREFEIAESDEGGGEPRTLADLEREIELLRMETDSLRAQLDRADQTIFAQLQAMRALDKDVEARNKYSMILKDFLNKGS